ncbi:MAG: hypothetical protein ACP5RT_01730 [Candidatus Micrarchaeia archaeon]
MEKKSKLYKIIRNMIAKVPFFIAFFIVGVTKGSSFSFDIIMTLSYIQQLLMHIGPMLSALLFIVAGIFYSIGQVLPPDKRANFHTASINIIIGAIVVAVLSVASNSLALASTHLLVNISSNSLS